MAAAAWLVRNETQEGEERTFLLEVSGAAEPVPCTVRKTATGFEGTVEMPGVPVIQEASTAEWTVPMVRFEGITHLIFEGACFSEEEAGNILVRLAAEIPDKAIGLLRWNRETQEMLPLVYVRESNSMVREHGCGSGSAAVGAYEALRSGREMFAIPVRQPGGIIRVDVRTQKDTVCAVSITGQVRLGQETIITI
jgi:diaminopimelate epimerase